MPLVSRAGAPSTSGQGGLNAYVPVTMDAAGFSRTSPRSEPRLASGDRTHRTQDAIDTLHHVGAATSIIAPLKSAATGATAALDLGRGAWVCSKHEPLELGRAEKMQAYACNHLQ